MFVIGRTMRLGFIGYRQNIPWIVPILSGIPTGTRHPANYIRPNIL